ncbi:hypothetical protein QE152_g6577 [Popillia japonica]|uniref:Uncharacterized protein n=1 Tax=Popillia japonica TaxID=7064 RepID=A0AAW1MHZ7_POPJA
MNRWERTWPLTQAEFENYAENLNLDTDSEKDYYSDDSTSDNKDIDTAEGVSEVENILEVQDDEESDKEPEQDESREEFMEGEEERREDETRERTKDSSGAEMIESSKVGYNWDKSYTVRCKGHHQQKEASDFFKISETTLDPES